MSTEITNQKPSTLKGLLSTEVIQTQIARALPQHLNADRFTRIAITALSRTPKLAECTQESFMKCLLDLSAMGLEPDGRRAHLIPYGKECTLIIDFKGLVELIRRSGEVVSIRSETVCEKDFFEWENGQVTHRADFRQARGEVQAVYAEAVMKSGEKQTAVLTRDEVEAIRKRSRSGNNGPWSTDWSEMAKKTAVRRLSKMMPLSSEIMSNIERDDDQYQQQSRNASSRVVDKNPYAEPDPQEKPAIEVEAEVKEDGSW